MTQATVDAAQVRLYENPGPANKAEPPRDWIGRYKLPHPNDENGKQYGFQRVTTHAKTLEDTFHLDLWKQRQVVRGLLARPDLLALAATVTEPESAQGKKDLNEICEKAMEAVGSGIKANLGTALHSYAEQLLSGASGEQIPKQFHPDLLAYRAELARLGITELPYYCERVTFNEHFQVSGRFDRIVRLADGTLAILDLKTRDGDLDTQWGAIAIQLATYANSGFIRNYETSRWEPMPNVRKDIALVVHLPVGRGEAHVYQVNITAGWWGSRIAAEGQQWRKTKQLAAPYIPEHAPKAIEHPTPEQLQQGQQPAPIVPQEALVPDAVDPFAQQAPVVVNPTTGQPFPVAAVEAAEHEQLQRDPGTPGTWQPTPQQVAAQQPVNGGHPAWSSAQQANIMLNPDGTAQQPNNGWKPTPEQVAQAQAAQQVDPFTGPNATPHMQTIAIEAAERNARAAAATGTPAAAAPRGPGRPAKQKPDPRTASVDELATLPKAELQNLLRGLDPTVEVARQRKTLAQEIVRLRDAMTGSTPPPAAANVADVPAFSAVVSNAPGPVAPDPTPQYPAQQAPNPFGGQQAPAAGPMRNEAFYLQAIAAAKSKTDLASIWQDADSNGVPWSDALNAAGIARNQVVGG